MAEIHQVLWSLAVHTAVRHDAQLVCDSLRCKQLDDSDTTTGVKFIHSFHQQVKFQVEHPQIQLVFTDIIDSRYVTLCLLKNHKYLQLVYR